MRLIAAQMTLICLTCAVGCTNTPPKPPVVDANGVTHYSTSRTKQSIPCQGPIQLEGDRTELTLTGPCRFVRITGSHNDIGTDIAPGGTIEITGGHNDVTWHQTEPGPLPQLLNHGESNTFHRSE